MAENSLEVKLAQQAQRVSEARRHAIIETALDGFWLIDLQGHLLEVNDTYCRMSGYRAQELLNMHVSDIEAIETSAKTVEHLKKVMAQGHERFETRHRRKDGSVFEAEVSVQYLAVDEGCIVVFIRDVTEKKKAERELRLLNQELHSLLNSMAEGAYGVDLNGNCTFVNRSFLRLLGYECAEEVVGKHVHELIHHSHADGTPYPAENCRMYKAYKTNQNVHCADEVFWRKDGTYFPVEYWSQPIHTDDGMVGAIATFIDIAERKQAEEKIAQLAFYDELTRLPNRRLLVDRLSQALVASHRNQLFGAVLVLDLDNFKVLNDTQGHSAGDMLLIEVAKRLTHCVREMDTVARFGGDEFVVMLGGLSTDKAESISLSRTIAEKIRVSLAEPYVLNTPNTGVDNRQVLHRCSASIGGVIFMGSEITLTDILELADAAMYQAKKSGGNGFRLHGEVHF